MNVPAILGVFKVLRDPRLCLPHATIANFNQLPIPVSKAFGPFQNGEKAVDIKAIVLDKDNCFAEPYSNSIYPAYAEKFRELVDTYSPANVLIVSNSSGLASTDPSGHGAEVLERNTGVTVLRHSVRKPSCGDEILQHFGDRIHSPSQIAVIGDRLFTDMVMANLMGAHSIWIKSGVVPDTGIVTKVEYRLSDFLFRRGYSAPRPSR